MSDKLDRVVQGLLKDTTDRKVGWHDASTVLGGDVFRVNFGDAVVEISADEVTHFNDEVGEYVQTEYLVRVLNDKALVVAEKRYPPGGLYHKQVGELYSAARAVARNQDAILDSLLTRLSK